MNTTRTSRFFAAFVFSLFSTFWSEEHTTDLKNVTAIVGLSANMTGLLFGVGMALLGHSDELHAGGVIITIAFACGTLSLVRLLRSSKPAF